MRTILLTVLFCTTFIQFLSAQSITDSLLLYYNFDGNANGILPSHNAVVDGAALTTDRNNITNAAYLFDGLSNSMHIANDSAYKVQYPITISAWIYTTDSSNNGLGATVFSNNDLTSVYHGFSIQTTPQGEIAVGYGTGVGAGSQYRRTATSSERIKSNEWSHIVGVIEGPVDMKIYINGVAATILYSGSGGSIVSYSADSATIGARYNPFGAPVYFEGKIDEIGFWNRALSATDVNTLYSNPLSVGLLLYYSMDNTLVNSGLVSNVDLTVGGGALQTTGYDNTSSSAYSFDGVDDALNFPGDNAYKVQYPVTMSAWVYMLDSTNNNQSTTVFSNNDINSVYYGISLGVGSDGTVNINYGTGGGAGIQFRKSATSTSLLRSNQWVHLTGVIEGPNDMRIFINGIEDVVTYSGTGGATIVYDAQGGTIGSRGNPFGAVVYFNGKIDEVKFWNRALSPSEIAVNAQGNVISSISYLSYNQPFELTIAPNPVNNQFTIMTELTNYNVTIFDINGQMLMQDVNRKVLNMEYLPAGIYFLKIDNQEKAQSNVLKFLKN